MSGMRTPSQTVGPFFLRGLEWLATGSLGPNPDRTLRGSIFDGNGDRVNDAVVELWNPELGWARALVDEDGVFSFRVSRPLARRTGSDGALVASSIRVTIFARGLLRAVVTRFYFPDREALDSDSVLATLDKGRQDTLVATEEGEDLRFDVFLQGPRETVFFDVE